MTGPDFDGAKVALHEVPSWRRVYDLATELRGDPQLLIDAQALSLDPDRPFGLKPVNGLFASNAWWESIRVGRIRSHRVTGTIEALVFAGMDSHADGEYNSMELRLDDGRLKLESIYANDERDVRLFQPGVRVECRYALLEMKAPRPDGSADFMEQLLEMSVSL